MDGSGPEARSTGNRWLRSSWFWLKRYAPPEIAGTTTMIIGGMAASGLALPAVVVGLVGSAAESVGFYAVAGIGVWHEQRRNFPARSRWRILARVLWLMILEFGPAELIDTLLVRPGAITLALLFIPSVPVALVTGKVVADVLFYVLAATAFRVTERSGIRGEAE